MIELNRIYNEDCLEGMKRIPDNTIDLTVTSPPYDNLRTYNGNIAQWSFEKFQDIAKELYRVTKQGGVVVWIVADATIKGSETGTSFRQALYFKECGFNIETMIWEKTGCGCLGSNKFYGQNFEFMFIFTKGTPKTANLICDRENKVKNGTVKVNSGLDKTGKGESRVIQRKPFGKRNNIWRIDPQKNSEHPAPFPEQLAQDHITSWSNEGDIVLDPFMGSGTTAVACINTNRNYIGFELDKHYCDIANERVQKAMQDKATSEKGL
jgi:DNA modification methylase